MRAVGDARLGHHPALDRRDRGVHDMELVVGVAVGVIGEDTEIGRHHQGV